MKKYVCMICGFIYDEAIGIPSAGIAAGTKWEDLPPNWVCPLCGAPKSSFKEKMEKNTEVEQPKDVLPEEPEELRPLSVGEMSALCSNLARGCEKQYLKEESALFTQLAEYFERKTPVEDRANMENLHTLVQKNLQEEFAVANNAAEAMADRGAKRALVWSEKVTHILNSLLSRYEKEEDAFLLHTNVYVCETCGFIYVGEAPPEVCPICKVPNWKMSRVERRQTV
ncbi:MAG: rubredoxin [Lachnospiraceae bacterium]